MTMSDLNPASIALSETWLDHLINDKDIDGYNVSSQDRNCIVASSLRLKLPFHAKIMLQFVVM